MTLLRRHLGGFVAAGAAVLWLVLALDRPGSTFHFAPLIVAGAWPVITRVRAERHLSWAEAGLRAAGGLLMGATVGLILLATDSLEGPSLWDEDSAALETALFALIGAVGGTVLAAAR